MVPEIAKASARYFLLFLGGIVYSKRDKIHVFSLKSVVLHSLATYLDVQLV